MNWYKISQELYRGDQESFDINDYDHEYVTEVRGGPGIYFTTDEQHASEFGSVTKKTLQDANILTNQSPPFNYQQIDSILQSVNKERVKMAVSNWDEDYDKGKSMLIKSISNSNNPIDQIMLIWADVFYHQNPNEFVELMVKIGIDGISIPRHDSTHYVIYNKSVLK